MKYYKFSTNKEKRKKKKKLITKNAEMRVLKCERVWNDNREEKNKERERERERESICYN